MRHTVVIPSYNTLPHLKNTYESIKRYGGDVDIIIIDDASEDGTSNWLLKELKDDKVQAIISRERKGHTYWYDEGMRLAKTDIVSILHSDMIIGPGYFENMLKHLERGKIVCATRIEPPIHPAGKEKIVRDFGDDAHKFMWDAFEKFTKEESLKQKDNTTRGIFAPWILYKDDHLSIGGHDPLFAPQSKEDSDLFNRFVLNGYEIIQSWDALVYHFTSRGSRFNKHSGGSAGNNSQEWLHTTSKNMRNFIRKWGNTVQHDPLMKPIITPKYSIKIRVRNCTPQLLELLEPWCDLISVDLSQEVIDSYISKEESNTIINLRGKINTNKESEIELKVNGKEMNQQDFHILQQIPQIIQQSGTVGEFKLGNLELSIEGMTDRRNDLIKS